MGKDIALGKRAKISQAQQYMILSVLGASIFLGAAVAVIVKSVTKISFNSNVIVAICTKPSGSVYTDEELKKCSPNSIRSTSVPNTLRSNILEVLASSTALESVANQGSSVCLN